MNSHADTIRTALSRLSVGYPGPEEANAAHAALDALLAEVEQLRAALADKTARLDIALGVFDDHDEARIDYESLVEHAEDRAARG